MSNTMKKVTKKEAQEALEAFPIRQAHETLMAYIEQQEEAEPEAPKRWRAEKGRGYCFLGSTGNINNCCETGSDIDSDRWARGNYYWSSVEAVAANNRILERQRILDTSLGFIR